MPILQTVLGPVTTEELGLILPHEHLFTDLRGPQTPGYAQADPQDVVRVMQPYLDKARKAGVTALVECSTGGVGRNARVLEALARQTNIALVAPAGVYREEFMPSEVRGMDEDELTFWMIKQITEGIDGTRIRAGFLKMAVSNERVTEHEARALRAAARASLTTGAVIASHTSGIYAGYNAMTELDLLASRGLSGERFIWVHAHNEANSAYHQQVAARGAYLEYDALAPEKEERFVRLVLWALSMGLERQIMLSHDAGWYRPGEPNGGAQRGFTYLTERFLPRLEKEGVSVEMMRMMTEDNPKQAFALVKPVEGAS